MNQIWDHVRHQVWLRAALLAGICLLDGRGGTAQAATPQVQPIFEIDFNSARLQPPHWRLRLQANGAGQFDADGMAAGADDSKQMHAGDVHQAIQLSDAFTARIFAVARSHKFFGFPCESHMKVAFQGKKRLSYSGPDGSGSCEYNYSKDKEIQELGDALMGVENTLLSGARLEMLLQHDRLGLDQEMESLVSEVHEGNAIELGTIRETLTKIAGDDQVLERARKKARLLLAQVH
jgi:hypothetical protein